MGIERHMRTRRAGFTLLELVAVLTIMAIVLLVAMPRMQSFSATRRLNQAATDLLAMTRYARTMAVSEGRTYQLHIDRTDHLFYLTSTGLEGQQQLRNDHGRAHDLAHQLTIEWRDTIDPATRGYIEFSPDGESDVATLRLEDLQGNMLDVRNLSPGESFHIHTPREMER